LQGYAPFSKFIYILMFYFFYFRSWKESSDDIFRKKKLRSGLWIHSGEIQYEKAET
jgi:hypothetical protein